MKTRKLALILSLMLMLTLVLIVPVYAQETTPEPTEMTTAEPDAVAGIDVTTEPSGDNTVDAGVDTTLILEPTEEALTDAATTVEATSEATLESSAEATAEATVEAAADAESGLPEAEPVAGVAEAPEEETPRGASLLVLLVGLGAVGVVGFATYMRQKANEPQL